MKDAAGCATPTTVGKGMTDPSGPWLHRQSKHPHISEDATPQQHQASWLRREAGCST